MGQPETKQVQQKIGDGTARPQKETVGICAIFACLYFLAMPLTIVTIVPGLSLLKLVTLMIGAVFVVKLFVGNNRFSFNSVHLFYALYLVYSYSTLITLNIEYARVQLQGMLESFIAILFISSRVYNQREKRWIENAWILVGVLSCVLGFTSTTIIEESRITLSILGGEEDPNQFCGYFIIPMMFGLERLVKKDKFWYLYLVYLIAIVMVVFKTGSRGGLVAVLAPVAVYAFVAARGLKNRLKVILIGTLAVVLFVSVIFPSLPETTQERFSVERVAEDRGSGRFDVWQLLVTEVLSDWKATLTGYGIGSTIDILGRAHSPADYAHNHWIQMWCDEGLIGVLLYGFVILAAVIRNWKRNMPIVCALVGLMALSMSLTLYVFKPVLNILLMSAMSYEGELKYEQKS